MVSCEHGHGNPRGASACMYCGVELHPEPAPPYPPWPGVAPWSDQPPPGSVATWREVRVEAPPLPTNRYDDLVRVLLGLAALASGLVAVIVLATALSRI